MLGDVSWTLIKLKLDGQFLTHNTAEIVVASIGGKLVFKCDLTLLTLITPGVYENSEQLTTHLYIPHSACIAERSFLQMFDHFRKHRPLKTFSCIW